MSKSTEISDLGKDFRVAFRGARRVIWPALGVALAAWLLSGMSCVKANQVGFVRRFGRVVRMNIEPGFTFLLPWPIDRLDTVPKTEMRRAESGFSVKTVSLHARINVNLPANQDIPYCLTGDQHIIHISMVAQYQIKDPYRYSYENVDADAILIYVLNDAIITCAAQMSVDGVLTIEKERLRSRTRQLAQRILDELGTGLLITDLQLETPPTVPRETEAAFQSVVNAKVGMQTAKFRAVEFKERIGSEAEGRAAQIKARARAAKYARVADAEAEAKSFLDVWEEYRQNKPATRIRMYLDTMGYVMGRVKKYVLPRGRGAVVPRGEVPPALRAPK